MALNPSTPLDSLVSVHNAMPLPFQRFPSTPATIPDYELLRLIGQGSYGQVWLARSATGALRAIKIVYRASFEHERPYEREFEGIKKFEPLSQSRETQVAIFHVGRNDTAGFFYYVMELADDASNPAGGKSAMDYIPRTLRQDLERTPRLPLAECLRIGLALTTALDHLHKHGLIHRDIKPSNIIFVNGAPKLADIGLITDSGDSRSIVGTEGYIAPEGPGTPQADIFSLGKVLYEISMGRDRRDFPDLPLDWKEVSERKGLLELNEVLLRACARDSRERYSSANKLAEDLKAIQLGRSVRFRHVSQTITRHARKPVLAPLVTAILAILAYSIFTKQPSVRMSAGQRTRRRTSFIGQA